MLSTNPFWFQKAWIDLRKSLDSVNGTLHDVKVQVESIASNYKTNSQDVKPQENPPINVIVSFPQAATEYYESKSPKKRFKRWSLANLIVSLLTLFVLSWYACTTHQQWVTMEQTLGTENKVLTATQNSARFEQRAWIKATVGRVTMAAGIPLLVPVTIDNVGNTPAKSLYGTITANILHGSELPIFDYAPGHPKTVFRSGIFNIKSSESHMTPVLPKVARTPDEVAIMVPKPSDVIEFLTLKTRVCVHGEIHYDDIFGVHHWLTFCQASALDAFKDVEFIPCAQYNRTDDYQEYPDLSTPFIPPPDTPLVQKQK